MSKTPLPARDIVIPTASGLVLRGRHWTHPDPRGVVVVAHGFGEHGGCYAHVAESLVPGAAVDVVAPDLRGHGRSPGRRGVVKRYDDLVADFLAALDWVARARPGLPPYVLGHSNGGQVALRAALDGPGGIAGLILSNPSLRLATKVPRHKVQFGKFLLKVAPGVTLGARIAPERLTHDPVMQEYHRADPLRHSRMSAPFFFGMVEGGRRVAAARASELSAPLLLILGGADPVVDASYTRGLFDAIGSPDKTLLDFPEMLHEPLNEIGREPILGAIADWLRTHLDHPEASAAADPRGRVSA